MSESDRIFASIAIGLVMGFFVFIIMWCKDYLDWVED